MLQREHRLNDPRNTQKVLSSTEIYNYERASISDIDREWIDREFGLNTTSSSPSSSNSSSLSGPSIDFSAIADGSPWAFPISLVGFVGLLTLLQAPGGIPAVVIGKWVMVAKYKIIPIAVKNAILFGKGCLIASGAILAFETVKTVRRVKFPAVQEQRDNKKKA